MADTRNADLTFGASDFLVHVAPLNTTAPLLFADPATPWQCMGWVTTEGGTFGIEDESTDVQAAGSLEPIRTLMTRSTKTMAATYQEALNPLVRSLYDNVPVADLEPDEGVVSYGLPDKPNDLRYAFVFDTVDGDKRNRLYMPNGKVTARGEEQAQTTDVWGVQMTFTFYKGLTLPAVTRSIDFGDVDVSGFFPVTP